MLATFESSRPIKRWALSRRIIKTRPEQPTGFRPVIPCAAVMLLGHRLVFRTGGLGSRCSDKRQWINLRYRIMYESTESHHVHPNPIHQKFIAFHALGDETRCASHLE